MNTQEAIGLLNYMLRDIENDAPNDKNAIEAQALTHAIEHMKRFQWQPIESAPKDGMHIFVSGGIAYWKNDACGGGWYTITGVDYPGRCIEWDVTHWMPLPDAPEVTE